MKLRIAWVGKTKEPAIQQLTSEYLKRISRYNVCESHELASEEAVLKLLERPGRTAPVFVALDPCGKQLTSEELAETIRGHLDGGTQDLLFAIGPADGWSSHALSVAQSKLSLGKMTLPHELARVVLVEQIYRAFTILRGHPYHSGH